MKQPTMIPFILLLMVACSKPSQQAVTAAPAGAATPPPATGAALPAPLRIIHVRTTTELKAALLAARAGDEIVMADGIYNGRFVIDGSRDGSSAHPVVLRGSRDAVLDAGSIQTGYVLHLQADHWVLKGFTVRNGLKGIMADGTNFSLIDSLKVEGIGDEGIHLRKFSSHNTIKGCTITNIGLTTPDYGEGVYIGSAKSNWTTYTNGQPDRCDSNKVLDNFIGPGVAAECIDIKEGTTGGIVRGNRFDATGIQGANAADSWIDVKGNHWLIERNTGTNTAGSALLDGYQVHVALNGWGNYNEFKANQCSVNAGGYGFMIKLTSSAGTAVGNKVYADNQVSGAARGVANIPLTP